MANFCFLQLFLFFQEAAQLHTYTHTRAHTHLTLTHTERDTEVRIMDLSEQLCCCVCGRYFILPPGWMSPRLWHRRPSPPRLPPSHQPSPTQLSLCLPGTGLISQQPWDHIHLARVTAHRHGDGGRTESIWTLVVHHTLTETQLSPFPTSPCRLYLR